MVTPTLVTRSMDIFLRVKVLTHLNLSLFQRHNKFCHFI